MVALPLTLVERRAFIDVCKQALNKLNVTLQRSKHAAGPEEAQASMPDDASQVTTSGIAPAPPPPAPPISIRPPSSYLYPSPVLSRARAASTRTSRRIR